MGDAGSERSKAPSLPPRCPCGFWGSSKTMNLCSKCFAAVSGRVWPITGEKKPPWLLFHAPRVLAAHRVISLMKKEIHTMKK
ncbi:AN1-type zinc finger protein 3, partial [Varanus komodoensis]